MDNRIVYRFLRDLGTDCVSYMGKIIEAFEKRRSGIWNEETFESVKKGLKLWWNNRYEFYVYLRLLGGVVWAA